MAYVARDLVAVGSVRLSPAATSTGHNMAAENDSHRLHHSHCVCYPGLHCFFQKKNGRYMIQVVIFPIK